MLFLIMQLVKILKYHGFKNMFGLKIKMTLAALVQHKTKICPADYHDSHWSRAPNLYHLGLIEHYHFATTV